MMLLNLKGVHNFSNKTDVYNPNLPPYLFPIYVNGGNWGNVPSFGGKH